MTVPVDLPNGLERYVDANGRLTIEGQKLFRKLVLAVQDMETRLKVLEP
jgi:hypothetical protein